MSEKQRVLDMIEQGKITATEAMELLTALEETQPVIQRTNSSAYKTLKVKVEVEKDDVDININIPLQFIKLVGGAAKDFSKYLPDEAKDKMHSHGVDISTIDFEGIIKAIEEGTLDEPSIVDINIKDKENGNVLVKVYVE